MCGASHANGKCSWFMATYKELNPWVIHHPLIYFFFRVAAWYMEVCHECTHSENSVLCGIGEKLLNVWGRKWRDTGCYTREERRLKIRIQEPSRNFAFLFLFVFIFCIHILYFHFMFLFCIYISYFYCVFIVCYLAISITVYCTQSSSVSYTQFTFCRRPAEFNSI